jgi:alpha-acetolactate decarboxylase
MAASGDRVRLDIGLEGGSTLTVAVTVLEADSLEERLRKGDSGIAVLEAEDGRLIVVLSHVLYVRRHARGSRVGFSAAT